MRTFNVKITSGTSSSLFTVYYDVTDNSHIALIDPTFTGTTFTDPAINLTYSQLSENDGVLVEVPDGITSLILYDQNDFCTPITSTICDTSIWTYDGTKYYRDVITTATPPAYTGLLYQPTGDYRYGSSGTTIYDTSGVAIVTGLSANVWKNNGVPSLQLGGPLNRSGLWTNTTSGLDMTPTNQWIGFSVCLTGLQAGHTYYIGLGADNKFSLWFNEVKKFSKEDTNVHNFNYWHVYPIVAQSGNNVLELYGLNTASIARFGCEVYDNTLADLMAASVYGDLTVVFASDSRIGTAIDVGRDPVTGNLTTYGYTCPGGGTYSTCVNGCVQKLYCYNT